MQPILQETIAMSTVVIRIGKSIREARKRRRLSQEALAELAGINRSFLGEIERGEATPSIQTLQKLANGMDVKLSELIRQYEQLSE
jgi:transcriptional regulator with XRE-family HTH domain